MDVIEIDAATNRGIDEIRELRDAARYAPSRDRYKIYILDEAHQITEAAFNALLKTLEEPPAHVIFMMATTQPEDIPQTIRSRCQHFSFHAVKFDDILAQLKMIAGQEEVVAEDAALALLAEAGDGSMRDALSIMDQAIASAPVENGRAVLSAAQIRELMGSVPNAVFERLLEAVAAGQSAELMEQLNLLVNAGHNPSSLARQMVRYLRNTLMAKLGGEQTELLQISGDERARAARTALLFTEEELTRNLQIVLRTFDDLNYRQEQRFHLELGLLKLIHAQRLLPIEELLSGVVAGGGLRSAAPASAPTSASRPSASPARPAAASASSSAPPLSPFGPASGSWSSGPKMQSSSQPVASFLASRHHWSARRLHRPRKPPQVRFKAPRPSLPLPLRPPDTTATLTEGALAVAPQAAVADDQSSQHRAHPPRRRQRAGRGRPRFGGAIARRGQVDHRWLQPAHRGDRHGQEDARPYGQCRGREDHSPGVATAGRAHALSGRSRRRNSAVSRTDGCARWPAAFRRPRLPIRWSSARKRSSRPRCAASSICAKSKRTLQMRSTDYD